MGVEPAELSSEIRAQLASNDVRVRWLVDGTAYVLPEAGGWLVLGEDVVVDEAIRPFLPNPTLTSSGQRLYRLPNQTLVTDNLAFFAEPLALLDVEIAPLGQNAGQIITLTTHWQMLQPTERPLKIFVHALDANGGLVGQWDGLSVAPTSLRMGDQFMQWHQFAITGENSAVQLLVGVYDGATLDRLGEPVLLPVP